MVLAILTKVTTVCDGGDIGDGDDDGEWWWC